MIKLVILRVILYEEDASSSQPQVLELWASLSITHELLARKICDQRQMMR